MPTLEDKLKELTPEERAAVEARAKELLSEANTEEQGAAKTSDSTVKE